MTGVATRGSPAPAVCFPRPDATPRSGRLGRQTARGEDRSLPSAEGAPSEPRHAIAQIDEGPFRADERGYPLSPPSPRRRRDACSTNRRGPGAPRAPDRVNQQTRRATGSIPIRSGRRPGTRSRAWRHPSADGLYGRSAPFSVQATVPPVAALPRIPLAPLRIFTIFGTFTIFTRHRVPARLRRRSAPGAAWLSSNARCLSVGSHTPPTRSTSALSLAAPRCPRRPVTGRARPGRTPAPAAPPRAGRGRRTPARG